MRLNEWFERNMLWIAGLALMLASSGLDGSYMSMWMSNGWGALGYVLNSVADLSGMILTYHYGLLQRSRDRDRRDAAHILGIFELVSVAYSWFFSWRQLRFMIPAIETNPLTGSVWEVEAVAFVSAGFVPLLLAAIGYVQSVKIGVKAQSEAVKVDSQPSPTSSAKASNPSTAGEPAKSVKAGLQGLTSDSEKTERLRIMLDLYRSDPYKSASQVADTLDVSRTTVYSYLTELQEAGIIHKNGDGVTVKGV